MLAARGTRVALVRAIVDGLSDDDLERVCPRAPAPGYPEEARSVGLCLGVVMREECEHRRYAVRDLATLEADPDAGAAHRDAPPPMHRPSAVHALRRRAEPEDNKGHMDLEAFELVLLRRPDSAPDYPDEEIDRIQRAHLAFYAGLRASGQVVTNGPVEEPGDPALRGLGFYRTGSHRRRSRDALAEADPAVRAGRLAVEIMTWYCPPGTMSQPGRLVTLT